MSKPYDYSIQNLVTAFHSVGLETGSSVFVHSNIGYFGKMKDADTREELCRGVMKALKDTVSQDGTLIFPTFSYSFCKGELYDPLNSKSDCGMLSQYTIGNKGFIRSLDANFSISAWGRLAEYYTCLFSHESFGTDSFWSKFMKENGLILFLNTDCSSTFIHYIEKSNNVPYRYNKAFNGKYVNYGGEIIKDYFVHYVCDLDKYEDKYTGTRLYELCNVHQLLKWCEVGRGRVTCTKSKEFYDTVSNELKVHPRFLTNGGDDING